MRIAITGGKGMLGRTLQRRLSGHELAILDLPEVDIVRPGQIDTALTAFRPQVVLHCAALTAVDRCETESDLAYAVNALGSAHVAAACHRQRARLIAISTDYVFDGRLGRPAHEWDQPAPLTVYGASKLAGELAVARHCPDHCILRVAWLYGPGGPSFLHTMIKLWSQEGGPMKVVDDQRGNPTTTDAVADLILRLLDQPLVGVVHATCEGEATWYRFAQAIQALRPGRRPLIPCTTAEFPRPAPRPADSRLEKRVLRLSGLTPMPAWEDALVRFLREHPQM